MTINIVYQYESKRVPFIKKQPQRNPLKMFLLFHRCYKFPCEKTRVCITGNTCQIGHTQISTIIDGVSLKSENELSKLGVLKLVKCDVLEDSYIRLRYQVVE